MDGLDENSSRLKFTLKLTTHPPLYVRCVVIRKYTMGALDLFRPNFSCQHSRAKFEYVFSKLLLNYQRHVRVISKPWQILKQLKDVNKFAITFSEGMGR